MDPSDWIVRFAHLVDPVGSVLDVASGPGRHARWFEARGHPVTALDRDADALATCGATETIRCDLETNPIVWPVAGRRFAAVVVTRYLHRPLFPFLLDALDEGGVLLYETFAFGNARFGKPANPDFLLAPGELLARCAGLSVVAFEDGIVERPSPASIQRICALRVAAPVNTRDDSPPRRHPLSPPAGRESAKSARIASRFQWNAHRRHPRQRAPVTHPPIP